MLATYIADPNELTLELANECVQTIEYYVLSETLSSLITKSPKWKEIMYSWMDSEKEFVKSTAYYVFADAHKEIWLFYFRKLILNRIYAQIQDLSKKIIIKSPGSFGASDIISECLPNSKIIILLRDGRDVIDSLLDARSEGGFMNIGLEPIISSKERISFIEYRTKMWVKLMENLLKTCDTHKEKLQLVVRYEDLRKNTTVEIQKIYRFIGIDVQK